MACRMNPQVANNQMEPIATNPFALQPVLSSYTYPLNAWHQLADRDTLRTLSVPPYIKDEVRHAAAYAEALLHHTDAWLLKLCWMPRHQRQGSLPGSALNAQIVTRHG